MTVNELMKILRTLDGNIPVVAAKFEMGFDEIREHRVVDLVMDVNPHISDSSGPHEIRQNVEVDGHRVCKALLLGELEPSLIADEQEKSATDAHHSV